MAPIGTGQYPSATRPKRCANFPELLMLPYRRSTALITASSAATAPADPARREVLPALGTPPDCEPGSIGIEP